MKRKGQRSLTMVVTFIILLVVSGVVINLFLETIQKPSKPKGAVEAEIQNRCGSSCSKIKSAGTVAAKRDAIVSYCTMTFPYQIGDVESDLIYEGMGYLSFCKNKARCFNFPSIPCTLNGDRIGPEMCRNIMCKRYGKRLPQNRTEEEIEFRMKKGACDLTCSKDDPCPANGDDVVRLPTWWQEYFDDVDCSDFFD